ncbi:hypothetical protein R5R35_009096 [Gryllus longicercus]|uniref:Osiris 20 n=1 Tax=Gryllus longicercus TaxID=2509291 RepID=A0AAN9VZD7_9ORTH
MARAVALACALLLAAAAAATAAAVAGDAQIDSNEVAPRLATPDDLLWEVADECVGASGAMHCLRRKVLAFLEAQGAGVGGAGAVGAGGAAGRALESDAQLDEAILSRVRRFVDTHQFRVQLPELFFQRATLTFRPARGLYNFQVHFPAEEGARDADASQARDMMKKKMLLPLLMLVKLKMKALTPILLALIGLKATKALVLSKIAILLVVGFLVVQLCKKLGMAMPAAMPMMPEMPPATAYGAPAPAPPTDSYAPAGWDSNGNGNGGAQGGPYSRVWTPTDAHQMAYNYYAQQHGPSQQQPQAARK